MSDRNLLFGILALQMDFIAREDFVRAAQAWALDKKKTLADHLVESRALSPENRALLEPLVDAHVRQHGNDPQRSLASISSVEGLDALRGVNDSELQASLQRVSLDTRSLADRDPFAATEHFSATSINTQGTRFRVLRPHAEGGLGRIFVARDVELGREVALKEIKPDHAHDDESRVRFTREAEITGGLEHPGIVPVYGLGQYPDGRPFYAMRFVRGNSLKEAIERFHRKPASSESAPSASEKNLALRKLLQRLIDVCEAIDYAHHRGVLHRDLKPGNIMLGRYGETLVVDWGLAKPTAAQSAPSSVPRASSPKAAGDAPTIHEPPLVPSSSDGSEPTHMGTAVGTPAFMSPEQAYGRWDVMGAASDVFSLGATLYAILTGRPPYMAENGSDVLRRAQQCDFPPPRAIQHDIPLPLEAICLKAMAAQPAERYESAREMALDLERYLADEPVVARRETPVERLRRIARRHRAWVQAGVAAALVVAIVAIVAAVITNEEKNIAVRLANEKTELATQLQKLVTERTELARDRAVALQRVAQQKQELSRTVVRNYFQRGISEYDLGRRTAGIDALMSAYALAEPDDPLAEAVKTVLADRVSQGGRLLLPPMQHSSEVHCVASSPDDSKLISGTIDGTVQLWDARTGLPIGNPMKFADGISHVEFSGNGELFAAASYDGTAQVWQTMSLAPQGPQLKHSEAIVAIRFSPNSQLVVTAGVDDIAQLWHATSGDKVGAPMTHGDKVVDVQFNAAGDQLVTASADSHVRFWNATTGAEDGAALNLRAEATVARYDTTGRYVATGNWNGQVQVWDVETRESVAGPVALGNVAVTTLAFHPDGNSLVAADLQSIARVWDFIDSPTSLGASLVHADSIESIVFHPVGTSFFTASLDGTVRHWNWTTQQALDVPWVHGAAIREARMSSDGRRIYSASEDGTVCVWNARSHAAVAEPIYLSGGAYSADISPDGRHVVTGGPADDGIQIWEVDSGEKIGDCSISADVVTLVYGPSGQEIFAVTGDGSLMVINSANGAVVNTFRHPHARYVAAAAFTADRSRVVMAEDFGTIDWFNSKTGEHLGELLKIPELAVSEIAVNPDASLIAMVADNVHFIDRRTKEVKAELPIQGVVALRFSPDGSRLLTTTIDHTAQLWDAMSCQFITGGMQTQAEAQAIAFSTDGRRMVTASAEGAVSMWQGHCGVWLGIPRGEMEVLHAAAFNADNSRLVTAGHNVTVWDVGETHPRAPEQFNWWLEAMTGMRISEDTSLEVLDLSEWLESCRKLHGAG